MSQIVYTIKLQKIRDAIRIVSEDEIPLEPFMTFVSQVTPWPQMTFALALKETYGHSLSYE